MEKIIQASKRVCPFLAQQDAASLRQMAASTGLKSVAYGCPVMRRTMREYSTQAQPVANKKPGAEGANFGTNPEEKLADSSASTCAAPSHAAPSRTSPANAALVPAAPTADPTTQYAKQFKADLDAKKSDRSYRYFNNVNRLAREFPRAHLADKTKKVTVWCANDYLGMGSHPEVVEAAQRALQRYGTGAGGTRNIAGHNLHAVKLESTLAELHKKDAALVFSSCFVANDAVLSLFGRRFPDLVYFSDEMNHASMILGIRNSRAKKEVFKTNDMVDLERRLASYPLEQPKIIAFESVYSMSGSVAPIGEIAALAKKYNALTFLDEVHAVGMYGPRGAGVAEHLDFVNGSDLMQQVDMISGTLGKSYCAVGGYITASANLIDWVRSYAPEFIFTTSLPPSVMASAERAVRVQMRSNASRIAQQTTAQYVKQSMAARGIPIVPNPSHICPVFIGDAALAKQASDLLLEKHGIYVQAINFPTVARGEERLRCTPTPGHTKELCDQLVDALDEVFTELGLKRLADWKQEGKFVEAVEPLWTTELLQQVN